MFVQISQPDGQDLGVADGDMVEVISRRGKMRGRARLGDIEPGNIFIPFHFGDWDRPGENRAANELTISGWDPVSKQPHFKYAAVKVVKIRKEANHEQSADLSRPGSGERAGTR